MTILLCATQRCGSTMIVEDMRNSEVLGAPREHFLPWAAAKEDKDWKAEFDKLMGEARSKNGVAAIKIMANQMRPVDRCLGTFVPAAEADKPFPHLHEAFRDATWIKLTRRDVVAQAISRVMAVQTGVYHAVENAAGGTPFSNVAKSLDPDYNAKVEYSYAALLNEVTAIALENLAWTRFFEAHGITPLEFVYEEVVADQSYSHLDAMAAAEGVEGPVKKVPRRLTKLSNHRHETWRERFFDDASKAGFRPRK